MRGEVSNLGPDAVIAGLAGRQHGVVGRAQLLSAGVRSGAIERRIHAGRLHPLHRGVYAVGHSWEYHRTRQEFENDRRRDRRLAAAGWTVLRITWRDLDEPGALERELRALGL